MRVLRAAREWKFELSNRLPGGFYSGFGVSATGRRPYFVMPAKPVPMKNGSRNTVFLAT